MIWRDDDVLDPAYGRLRDLLTVDDVLQRFGQRHTVAVLAKSLTPGLAAIIRARGMIPQLHGWVHESLIYSPSALAHLEDAVEKMADYGLRPTVLYPPFNHASSHVIDIAAALGLTVSTHHFTLSEYLQRGGLRRGEDVVNCHFWKVTERRLLWKALTLQAWRHTREVAA